MAVLGTLSSWQSVQDLDRLTTCNHSALTEALGLGWRRPPSDSSPRAFFQQVDMAALCAAIRDWTIAKIPVGAEDLDQLGCDGKPLRGSIEPTAGGGSAFIAQIMLYWAALGGVLHGRNFTATARPAKPPPGTTSGRCCGSYSASWISKACSSRLTRSIPNVRFSAAQGAEGRRPADREASGFSEGVGQPEDVAWSDQISDQEKRKIPFGAVDHEVGYGLDITWTLRAKQAPEHITEAWIVTSWIVDVTASGTRDTTPFHATHMSRPTREALENPARLRENEPVIAGQD